MKNWGRMAPDDQHGADIVKNLLDEVKKRDNIMLYTDAEMIEKSGNIGDFKVTLRVGEKEAVQLHVGAMLVATGFDSYQPQRRRIRLRSRRRRDVAEFRDFADQQEGPLVYNGKPVKNVVFVYCVGSRQKKSEPAPSRTSIAPATAATPARTWPSVSKTGRAT